ncbi:hypothetical protein [Massilia sp. ST3]|uniref:hypothetical protein n=1 Tax=Massilia sp. ST3 TaxID=2824903 RepID=UPI001B81D3A8|nr:hypothetical protein [Massilia sp. ST3]MBQ5949339.1 hypothetical protein [Massilia sp. ST3]
MPSFDRLIIAAAATISLSGCSDWETLEDVSKQRAYKHLVGSKYEIIGTVDAYGIRKHPDQAVEYMILLPRPGIAGWEVAYDVPLRAGTIVTIVEVYDSNRWPDNDITFGVRLEGTRLPESVPVRINLFGGNEGDGSLDLNPMLYRKR